MSLPGKRKSAETRNSFSTRHKRRRNKEIWAAQSRFILTFWKYPKDALAPGATYRAAQLLEFEGDYMKGANTYRWLVERYPSSPNFDEAIEGQFRIGEMYLSGKKIKLLGIPIGTSMDRAVEIFAAIVRAG